MKKLVFIIFFILAALFTYSSSCLFNAYRLLNSILLGDANTFASSYGMSRFCELGFAELKLLPDFLDNKKYIVLLQNNTELRPSGGFMGSYVEVDFRNNVLSDWKIEDIYVPDGQLMGHVDPPIPIQQAFGQGWWKLRDSNWDVDFEDATKDIEWFFSKGGVENIDGIVAINLGLVQKWLGILGPIKPVGFSEEVNSDNFHLLTQEKVQSDFFPGSIKKQSYLAAVAEVLWDRTKHASLLQKYELARLVLNQLNEDQVLIWMKDAKLNDQMTKLGWDGGLKEYDFDYLYVVETNLGANKANCCVERSVVHRVDKNSELSEKLEIEYENNSQNPPYDWGGDYQNYLRIVIPGSAQVTKVVVDGIDYQKIDERDWNKEAKDDNNYQIENYKKYKIVGFWVIVPMAKMVEVGIEYEQPSDKMGNRYNLVVQKQPGVEFLPYKLFINDKKVLNINIANTQEFSFKSY